MLLLVRSNSFSCEIRESRKYGESWRHSVNSSGRSPMLTFVCATFSHLKICSLKGKIFLQYCQSVSLGLLFLTLPLYTSWPRHISLSTQNLDKGTSKPRCVISLITLFILIPLLEIFLKHFIMNHCNIWHNTLLEVDYICTALWHMKFRVKVLSLTHEVTCYLYECRSTIILLLTFIF